MVEVDRPVRVTFGSLTFEQSGSEWLCTDASLDGVPVEEITASGTTFPEWLPQLLTSFDHSLRALTADAERLVKEAARTKFADFARSQLQVELVGIEAVDANSADLDYLLSTDLDPYADIYGIWSARVENGAVVRVVRHQT